MYLKLPTHDSLGRVLLLELGIGLFFLSIALSPDDIIIPYKSKLQVPFLNTEVGTGVSLILIPLLLVAIYAWRLFFTFHILHTEHAGTSYLTRRGLLISNGITPLVLFCGSWQFLPRQEFSHIYAIGLLLLLIYSAFIFAYFAVYPKDTFARFLPQFCFLLIFIMSIGGIVIIASSGLRSKLVNLRGVDLSFADLKNQDLRKLVLTGADMTRARLMNSDLRGAFLAHAKLQHADMRGVVLDDANLFGAVLREANLKGASLERSIMREVQLMGAVLQDANLKGARMQSAVLDGADLRGAKLNNASLFAAELTGSNLKDADVNGADFGDARGACELFSDDQMRKLLVPPHCPDDVRWLKSELGHTDDGGVKGQQGELGK